MPIECAIIRLAGDGHPLVSEYGLEAVGEGPIDSSTRFDTKSLGGRIPPEKKLVLLQRFQIGIAVPPRDNIIVSLLS